MQDKECSCKQTYENELSKLEVLTDLTEFAEQQLARGSLLTSGWADPITLTRWREQIGNLRSFLPECLLREFDDERKKRKEFRTRLKS